MVTLVRIDPVGSKRMPATQTADEVLLRRRLLKWSVLINAYDVNLISL